MSYHTEPVTSNALLESGGTTLNLGGVSDGSALVRSGSSIIGTSRAWGIATTSTTGLPLANTTPATAGVTVQYSPALELSGTAWKSNATAESQTNAWQVEVRPTAGAASTASSLAFSSSSAGGAYGVVASLTSTGVFSTGYVSVSSYVTAGAVMYMRSLSGTGLGTTVGVDGASAGSPVGFAHLNRTDGANNVVVFSCYDRGAASITNAATMRLHSFGWTNNADAYTELAAVFCDGSFAASKGIRFPAYATAAPPTAGAAGQVIYVTDGDTGSKCLAMWDGSNWLRIALGAAIASS